MTARTKPPFRADHVGSLLRPKKLLQAREDHASGRISAAELRATEDDAIRDVVKLQEDVGLQGVTDGEFRRHDWVVDFKYQLGGVTKLDKVIKVPFDSEQGKIDWSFVEYRVDKLSLDHCIFGEDFKFLKSVAEATPKITLPSPSMMHYPGCRGIDRNSYPDMEIFFDDLAKVYAKQIDMLGEQGCTYLQLDDTSLAFLNDPKRRAMIGEGAEKQHHRYIELFNASIANKPANMSICTHLCRGNYRSAWMAAGGYEHVADALFNGLNVDGFFLEYDDERSGGFEPLRFVPKGKMVVLGLVTTKRPALESKDLLKRRVEEASKFVRLDQICLSPQCGFASTSEGNELTIDEEAAKLRLVVETAREIWG
jgi:5-methyltetrahydropteroyltriglutamate--homocysteine methyltransferase